MTASEIDEYRQLLGTKDYTYGINLHGYTSCSLSKSIAQSFAWADLKTGHSKVLFHIKWKNSSQAYFLNGGAMDHEEEVLLYDGTRVLIESIEEVNDSNNKLLYTQITLKSPQAE